MNEDVYHNNNIAIERDFMSYELWSKTFYFGNMKKKKSLCPCKGNDTPRTSPNKVDDKYDDDQIIIPCF
jgi:hypothetical protein